MITHDHMITQMQMRAVTITHDAHMITHYHTEADNICRDHQLCIMHPVSCRHDSLVRTTMTHWSGYYDSLVRTTMTH